MIRQKVNKSEKLNKLEEMKVDIRADGLNVKAILLEQERIDDLALVSLDFLFQLRKSLSIIDLGEMIDRLKIKLSSPDITDKESLYKLLDEFLFFQRRMDSLNNLYDEINSSDNEL